MTVYTATIYANIWQQCSYLFASALTLHAY